MAKFKRVPVSRTTLPAGRPPRLADLAPGLTAGLGSAEAPKPPRMTGFPRNNLGKYLHPKKGA